MGISASGKKSESPGPGRYESTPSKYFISNGNKTKQGKFGIGYDHFQRVRRY